MESAELYEITTENGGYMVGSTRSKEAADRWASDYFEYRKIKCLVKEKESNVRTEKNEKV